MLFGVFGLATLILRLLTDFYYILLGGGGMYFFPVQGDYIFIYVHRYDHHSLFLGNITHALTMARMRCDGIFSLAFCSRMCPSSGGMMRHDPQAG